jgi:hypothetical protein
MTLLGVGGQLLQLRWLRSGLAVLFYAIAAVYVWQLFQHQMSAVLLSELVSVHGGVALVLALLQRQLLCGVWWLGMVRQDGHLPPIRIVQATYARASLGKYVPGKVFNLAIRVAAAPQLGISAGAVLAATVLEGMIALAMTLSIGVILVGWDIGLQRMLAFPVFNGFIAFSSIGLALVAVLLLARRRLPVIRFPHWHIFLSMVVLAGFGAFAAGGAFMVWSMHMHGGGSFPVVLLLGAAPLAGGIGTLAVLAPGGIGVRELVFQWLLQSSFEHEQLLLVIVGARLVDVIADVIFALIGWSLHLFGTSWRH